MILYLLLCHNVFSNLTSNSTFRNGPDHQLAQASLCSAKVAGNQPGNLVDII
jgi:hypothetical protein